MKERVCKFDCLFRERDRERERERERERDCVRVGAVAVL